MLKRVVQVSVLIAFVVASTGCASFGRKLKALMGGRPDSDVAASSNDDGTPKTASFNGGGNLSPVHDRKYKRVTRENFSDDQMLEENAGSLWRKEGQGSYLFSQNNLRQLGDIINVEIEGKAANNLTSKLSIIKATLARSEPPITIRVPASSAPRPAPVPAPEKKEALTPSESSSQQDQAKEEEKRKEEEKVKSDLAKFDSVPCRITDKNPDGSYRVKGQTSVYVGRHEYRLIVTGIVRNEDINQEIVGSQRVIEGKFDLVSTMKEVKHD